MSLNLHRNEEQREEWEFYTAHSCSLLRLFNPLYVNIASSARNKRQEREIHLQFCAKDIDRSGNKDYCIPCRDCVWKGYNCTACNIYCTDFWMRLVSYAMREVLVDLLTCAASNSFSLLWSLHCLGQRKMVQECTSFLQTATYLCWVVLDLDTHAGISSMNL